jgi:hypothetical protein
VGSMARALLPRTRRRGRSLIVGKVAAATSDLEVFFMEASEILAYSSSGPAATVRPLRLELTRGSNDLATFAPNGLVPHGATPSPLPPGIPGNYRYVCCGRDALSKLTCSYSLRLACCCSSESGRALPALSDCIKVISDNASSACRRLILR